MSALPAPTPIFKAFDNNGSPLALGFLTTYAAGTLTKIPSYVDASQTTQNTNPVQLNFRGECPLWLDPTLTYKFALTDVLGNTIPGWPVDNIPGNGATGGASIIPTSDNTFTLGSPSFSWANAYVGVNHAPVLDTVSGNIGYYSRTAAETSAGVTPTNFSYAPGNVFRYGALADGTTDDSAAVQNCLNVAAAYEAQTRTAAQRNINPAYFPGGAYLIKTPLTVPNGNGISVTCSNDAWFFYNDTVSVGSYMLTFGASGGGISFVGWDRLRISLLTVTAKGVNFKNCQDSYIDDYYCQGLVVAAGNMSSRTNVGLRIEATAGQESFWIRFGNVHLNHCHTGVLIPASGGFVGQLEFRFLNLFGDAVFGDISAFGINASAGQDVIVHGGYVESYQNTAGAGGVCLFTAACVRWKVSKVVFDVGGSPSGIMNGIVLAGPGAPSSNQFMQCMIDPATIAVSDGTTAVNGNLIENNPNIASIWTATLVPSTGTITLNSGVGGDTCFCVKRGNEVHVWGALVVASVAAPTGTLLIQGLPFTCANNNSNYAAATVWINGANASATTAMMAFVNRNSAQIEVDHFATGTSAGAAADIKAATQVFFNVTYAAVTAT